MICLAVTSTKSIYLTPTIDQLSFTISIFPQNFSKVILLVDLLKMRPKLILWLVNPDVAPFISIKLSSEYEGTHYITEGLLHGTKMSEKC